MYMFSQLWGQRTISLFESKLVLSYAVHTCVAKCAQNGGYILIHVTGRHLFFFSMYFWWNLCPLYLLAYQVSVTTGDLGLSCCVLVMFFECSLASCVGWFNMTICTTPDGSGVGTVCEYICVWVGEQSGNESMCDSLILPSAGHENNIAQPKTDKWLSSPSNFSLFNC